MFADRANIYIRSGKGGDGHVSFRRELFVAAGGPNGGDGGKGGDIIFVVDEGLNTLSEFRYNRKYCAEDGGAGGKNNCTGKDGADLIRIITTAEKKNPEIKQLEVFHTLHAFFTWQIPPGKHLPASCPCPYARTSTRRQQGHTGYHHRLGLMMIEESYGPKFIQVDKGIADLIRKEV